MKTRSQTPFPRVILLAVASAAHVSAAVLVNDTWLDGSRTDPASPDYSENGVDADADGNLESAWFKGGAGTLDVVGPGGPLRGDLGAGGGSSGSWTTYFTSGATPLTLASTGDQLRITWRFSVTGLGTANTSQNFRLAVVDSPPASVLAADGAPGDSTYAGYAMFMNMSAGALGNSSPFQLRERAAPLTSSALLGTSTSWTGLGNGATVGNAGYVEGVIYTYTMDLTRTELGLDIVSTMAGTGFNDSGSASVSFSDETPNSYSFNTFSIRPSSATGTAQIFDTTLFQVEYIPEPSSTAVLGVLAALGLCRRRRAGA